MCEHNVVKYFNDIINLDITSCCIRRVYRAIYIDVVNNYSLFLIASLNLFNVYIEISFSLFNRLPF